VQGSRDTLSHALSVLNITQDELVKKTRFRLALLTEEKKHITEILTNTIDDKAFDLHQPYDLPWEVENDASELELLNKIDIQGDPALQKL